MKRFVKYDYVALLIVVFGFFIVIGRFTPFSGNDWEWATRYAKQMIVDRFQNLNGRYVAHVSEIVAVRMPEIRALSFALGAVLLMIVMLSCLGITRQQRFKYICVLFLGIMLLPNEIYAQTFGWFAGYYTYIPVTVLTLFMLWSIAKIIYDTKPLSAVALCALYITALVGQWFVEHITLYHVILFIFANIVYLVRHRRLHFHLISLSLMTWIGAVVMFLNTAYFHILLGQDAFIKLGDEKGVIHQGLVSLIHVVPEHMFFNALLMLTIIVTLSVYMLYRTPTFRARAKVLQLMLYMSLLTFPVYGWFIYKPFNLSQMKHIFWLNVLQLGIAAVCFIGIIITVGYVVTHVRTQRLAIGMLISAPLSVVFALFLSPMYAQSFFMVHMIYIIIAACLIVQCEWPSKRTTWLLSCVTVLVMVGYGTAFYWIDKSNEHRIAQLKATVKYEKQRGDRVHTYRMPKLPLESRLYKPTPRHHYDTAIFKTYWKIPGYVKMKFVPYNKQATYTTKPCKGKCR